MRLPVKQGALAAPVAVLLSVLIAAQATAVTWSPRVRVTTSGQGNAQGLAILNSTTAVAIYDSGPHLYVRRTTNSGANWSARIRLTRLDYGLNLFAASAGRLNFVDVAFGEDEYTANMTNVRYRRSVNSGSSWQPAITLRSVPGYDVIFPGVGHGPGGVVAVAWHELETNTIRVRVSTDDGVSFGAEQTLANVTGNWMHPPAVAVGNGVVYVAYFIDEDSIRLRRSLDNGLTWQGPVTLGNNGSEYWNIQAVTATAQGDKAFVGFTVDDGTKIWTRFRRTNNRGGSWTSQTDLSPPSSSPSIVPRLTLQGARLHAAYEQCDEATCDGSVVMYRSRTTTSGWSAPEQASHAGPDWATPGGVGQVTRIMVLYTADNGDPGPGPNSDVFVRTGTP